MTQSFVQISTAMKEQLSASDEFLLREIGAKLARMRLEKNLTQAQLAEQAGISVRTLTRIESGSGASVVSAFIRICRALGLVERFAAIVPDPVQSPMEQLKMQGRQRKRASGIRLKAGGATPLMQAAQPPTSAQYYQNEDDGGFGRVAEDAPVYNAQTPPRKWKWGDET